MEARSEARATDMVLGIDLEDPKSPEALWLTATVLQATSPSRSTGPPAVTPSSAARQLFSPSHAPATNPTPAAQDLNDEQNPMLLAILKKKAENAAAAAAAAQELYLMEAAAVAAGLNISITKDPAAVATGSQGPAVAAAGLPTQPAAAAVLPPSSVAADADQLDQRSPAVAAAGLQGSQNPTAPAGAPTASTGAPTASAGAPSASAGASSASAGAPSASAGAPTASAGAPSASAGAPSASAGAVSASAGAPSASAGATKASAGALSTSADAHPIATNAGAYSFDFLRPAGSKGVQLDTVLLEAITRFRMDDKLLSNKLGISGLADLYRVTMGMHDDLKALVANPDEPGDNLRKEFANFYFSFMGLKDCSPDTAAAITMLHASKASQGFKLRINQALQASIGLDQDQIQTQANAIATTGRLPDRVASTKELDLITNGDWMGLLCVTVELLCFDANKPQTFERKRQELLTADLQQFSRCSEALAHILQLYQSATTAYGSEFVTMYDLLQLIISKLKCEIQYEINEVIATDKTLDLIGMDWRMIDNLVTDAWGTVSRRPAAYYDRLNLTDNHHVQTPATHTAAPFTSHSAITEATAITGDKTLQCQRRNDDGPVCNADFVWSAEEQMLHKRLGYSNTLKSCPKHKQPPRTYAGSPGCSGDATKCSRAFVEKCRLFQAGKCGFGDRCKFSHVEGEGHKEPPRPPEQLAIALPACMPNEDNEEEEMIEW